MEVLKFNAEGILANAPPPETEELLINSPAAIQTVELYIAPLLSRILSGGTLTILKASIFYLT